MNPETFLRWAEEYFGPYKEMVKREMVRELQSWTPEEITRLREEAREKISTQFKTPPDIHFVVTSTPGLMHAMKSDENRRLTASRRRANDRAKLIGMDSERVIAENKDAVNNFFNMFAESMRTKSEEEK